MIPLPTELYIRHIRKQAQKVRDLVNQECGEKMIIEGLAEWPELMQAELDKFRQERH